MVKEKKIASIIRLCILAIIILLGSALRLSFNSETFFLDPLRENAASNFTYADNLLVHSTFSNDTNTNPIPDDLSPPGYPVFIAANIWLADLLQLEPYDTLLFSQALLAAGIILLSYLIAREFLTGYWPLLPTALTAFSPHLVSLGSYALPATLFGFLLLLSLLCFCRSLSTGKPLTCLVTGFFLALTCMVNPVSIVLLPLLTIVLWFYGKEALSLSKRKNAAKLVALFLIPSVIAAGLWSLRSAALAPQNQATISATLLKKLSIGLYPSYPDKLHEDRLGLEESTQADQEKVGESAEFFLEKTRNRTKVDPLGALYWYTFEKPLMLWNWNLVARGDIYVYDVLYSLYNTSKLAMMSYSLMYSLHYWLIAFCLLGAGYLICRKRNQDPIPLSIYTTIASISVFYVATLPEAVYSVPLRPLLYLGATFFLYQASNWVSRTRAQAKS